ncbi:MAG: addiction module protein [Saprospiraceae bacterium]
MKEKIMSVETIKAQVDKLSLAEKQELFNYLRDTGVEDDDFKLSEEWKTELDRRRKKMESDSTATKPFHQFMEQYLNR